MVIKRRKSMDRQFNDQKKKMFEDNKWLSKDVNVWTVNSMTTGKKTKRQ
jgi:hypothetical protein